MFKLWKINKNFYSTYFKIIYIFYSHITGVKIKQRLARHIAKENVDGFKKISDRKS